MGRELLLQCFDAAYIHAYRQYTVPWAMAVVPAKKKKACAERTPCKCKGPAKSPHLDKRDARSSGDVTS